jgi:sugar lactone lactonase YvrE
MWDEREGCLWWVDIMGESVHRSDPATGRDEIVPIGQMVGAVVLRASGGLVAAVQRGFVAVDPASGRIDVLALVEADDPTMRMNDGKVDPAGRFWAGTMGVAISSRRPARSPAGHRLSRSGKAPATRTG